MSTPPPPPPGQPDESAQPTHHEDHPGHTQPAQDGGPQHPPQQMDTRGAPAYGQQQGQPHDEGQPSYAASALSPSEEKTWTILAHLSAPIAALVSVGMLNFVGPLVIWAIYKDRSPRVRHASAGAFNFNLTLWIVYFVLVVLGIVTLGIGFLLAIPLIFVVWVISMVLHIMAAVKASNGEVYTYPAQIKVLK